MEELLQMVGNNGLPIVLVFYLLLRFEGKLAENTETNRELHSTVKELSVKCKANQ